MHRPMRTANYPHIYRTSPKVLLMARMASHTGKITETQKHLILAVAFFVTFTTLFAIPFGVMFGALGEGWIVVASVLFYLTLAVMVGGAIGWFVLRLRRMARK